MTHVQCQHGQYPHCKRCDSGEQDNQLVHSHTQATRTRTLADLYRAGKKKGLLKSIKSYS